jgi:hypothetical protein
VLTSGDAAPVDFGPVVSGTGASLTFTIRNAGFGDLTGLSVSKTTGGNPGDFVIEAPATNTVAHNGATPFKVTFTPSAAGSRTATLQIASNDADENPFVIQLTGTQATAGEAWRKQYFGTFPNTGDAADLSDPDGDGIVNLMEYATGSNPVVKTPAIGVLVKNGNTLELTYTRFKAALGEVNYKLEWSETLPGTWSSLGGTNVTILSDDGVIQTVKSTLPAGTAGKRFVRLRVTRL